MKKILSIVCVALCCICSRADTNNTDAILSDILSVSSAIQSQLTSIGDQITGDNPSGYGVWDVLTWLESDILQVDASVSSIRTFLHNEVVNQYLYPIDNKLQQVRDTLYNIDRNLRSVSSISNDVSTIRSLLQTINVNVGSCKSSLLALVQYVSDIRNYTASLPQIEEYQSALSVVVSNINEHILAGINVSIPNTINVNVQNPLNFNPEWDFLSRTFQWGGWSFDNTWQQFSSPDSQDNTLQGAAPMSIPATTTLAEYLERLYVGINNSGRILNDSIIHACYLLEGSNTVSQAEQEEVSDSVSDSVESADTKMEQIASSIPTPTLGVDTGYISRGISFWDQIGSIQKPTSVVITTSPSDGELISIPEIHIEVELSKYPMLDKALEFARSVFTWLWWALSVFFLLWLFRRAIALYGMVMSLLGPQPVQTTAVDVV